MTRRRSASVGRAARRLDDAAKGFVRAEQALEIVATGGPPVADIWSQFRPRRLGEIKGKAMRIWRHATTGALLAAYLSFACLLSSGCATLPNASLSSAAALAKAGQSATIQMEQNVTISEQTLGLFRDAAAFNDGFNGSAGASRKVVSDVETIQKNLAQYGNLLQSLSSAYSAMEQLAEYGASPSLDSAVSSLVTDAVQFGKQTGKEITVPANVTTGIEEGGNVLVGSIQTEKVIKASEQIDSVLQQVIAVLSDANVRSAMLPIQGELQGVVDQAAFSIYTQGAYSYRTVIDALGAPLGLQSAPDVDTIVRSKSKAKLRAGLSAVVSQTVNGQVAAAGEAYDQGLEALKALTRQHQALQAKQPVALDNVLAAVSRLKALAQVASPQSAGESK